MQFDQGLLMGELFTGKQQALVIRNINLPEVGQANVCIRAYLVGLCDKLVASSKVTCLA